ncbi:MAG: hypothetical protein AB1847_21575 [bacterium]
MAKNNSKKLEIDFRRVELSKLWSQGIHDQMELAKLLSVDRSTITRDLKVLQEEWKQAAIVNIDTAKGEILAQIQAVKRENWAGWKRSCIEFKSKTIKAKGKKLQEQKDQNARPETAEQIIKTEDRTGDPRFLSNVLTCIERECKLLGIDAPVKNEHTGKSGGPIIIEDIRSAIRQQLKSNPDLVEKVKSLLRD